MTKADVVGIMAILETAYPQYYAKRGNQERMEAANLWAELFAADPAPVVAAAIKSIIVSSTNPFPPSIGEIKNKMHDLTTPADLSETEAWAMVSKAIRNGIYGYKAEFDKLPPTVKAAVGRAEQLREWAVMDIGEVESVVASNFMRGFKTIQKREREVALIPPDVRELLTSVSAAMLPEVTP